MARPLRVEFPGAVYHVISRGNARQSIYLSDSDRYDFLGILHRGEQGVRSNIPTQLQARSGVYRRCRNARLDLGVAQNLAEHLTKAYR